jgi:glycosyltransferase AglD
MGEVLVPPEQTELLVTIPIHNEAPRLLRNVQIISAALDSSGYSYRLALAEDGSTDGTQSLLKSLEGEHPNLFVRSNKNKQGRGKALRDLWRDFPAKIYAFTDADLATGPDSLLKAVDLACHGEPVVTGSRYVAGARVERPPLRHAVSRAYNWIVRQIFHDGVRDHQCGLKVFSRGALESILPYSVEDSWFWDTEVLVLASSMGLPITEIPVQWTETKATRTEFRRLLTDVFIHGFGALRLRGRVESLVRQQNYRSDSLVLSVPAGGSFPDSATQR